MDPGSEQARSVGKHWRGLLTSARNSQEQLLSGGLAVGSSATQFKCFFFNYFIFFGVTASAHLNTLVWLA